MNREEQITKAAKRYVKDIVTPLPASLMTAFVKGAEWADRHPKTLWHDAQGDDLPPIDKEVIVLCAYHDTYKVCFGHRPYEYVAGVSHEGKMTYLEAKTYGKGGWNIPDVKWWLDVELPNLEELQ